MNRGIRCSGVLLLLALPMLCAGEDVVAFLEGASTRGTVEAIDADGTVHLSDGSSTVMDDLYQIINGSGQTAEDIAPLRVELLDGSVFLATTLEIIDEECHVGWRYDRALKIGLDHVRSFRLKGDVAKNSYQRALRSKREEYDQLWIEVNGDLQMVKGVIEKVDADTIEFEWEEQKRQFGREQVYAIVTADIVDVDRPENAALVELSDGSRISGENLELKDDTLHLTYLGGRPLQFPWRYITRITVNTGRLAFLSDLQPTSIRQKMIVAPARSWQRDRSVVQQAMKVGGRAFRKGIGMTSGTQLKFLAGAQYDFLNATIGIDDGTNGRGDCIFVVTGDGEELYRQAMRGGDRARDIKLNVGGIDQVALTVEYGNDLDLSDHANWGDIRLVKGKK